MVCVTVLLCGVLVNCLVINAQKIAKEKCGHYNTLLKTFDGSLINVKTEENDNPGEENPHMAALGFGEFDGIKWKLRWKCVGTLISERYVLTAAHCLTSRDLRDGPVQYIRLGAKRLSYDSLGEVFEVETTIAHPDYSPLSYYNDIGLIKLRRPVKFSAAILPACLNSTHYVPESSARLQSVGWGPEGFDVDVLDTLWKTQLEYYGHAECQDVYENVSKKKLRSGIDYSSHLCAIITSKHKPCYIVAGSPLQVEEQGHLTSVLGVGSFSSKRYCISEKAPEVYTRVAAYVSWIESVVWE